MKKAILYSIVASLFFFSCKKEHSQETNNPVQKKYNVNFTVSGFTQTITNSASSKLQVNSLKTDAVTTIANYLDILYYYVFDSNGNPVHTLTQDSTASNFGNIADNLPSGTYTIVIAAGKKGLQTFTTTPNLTPVDEWYIGYNPGINFSSLPWLDTFYDKFQVTVSGDVNQSVTLNRIVGQLEVKILDTIPATANSISVTVNPEDFAFTFFPSEQLTVANPFTDTYIITNASKGMVNYTTTNLIGNTATPFTVTIVCYDASQKVLGTAIVNGVTCQKNTMTILSGDLFGSNNGFNISLNPWNPTPITIPFSNKGGIKQTN